MNPRICVGVLVVAIAGAASAGPEPEPGDPPAARRHVLDRVVAVVNGEVILDSELQGRLIPVVDGAVSIDDAKERARRIQKLTTQMLDQMVDEELMVQAAAEAKLEVEPGEVDAALADVKKEHEMDDATFTKALAEQGYTLATYKRDLRRQLLKFRAQKFLVMPKINVTDEDVRARYDQMQRRSESVSAVRLAHILFKVPPTPTEQELTAAKDKAAAAIARVRGGEPFAEVAKAVSEDTATAATGGELGWFERGTVSSDWEQVVFAMEKDDVRGPVSGPQGLHVFFAGDIKRTDIKPFDELKDQIKGELTRREVDKQTEQWLAGLRKAAYIDLKL